MRFVHPNNNGLGVNNNQGPEGELIGKMRHLKHVSQMKYLCTYISIISFFVVIHMGISEANSGLEDLPDVISKVKNSMVGVGTYQKTRRPPFVFRGTGFAVGDGRIIVTNAHVIPEKIDERHREFLTVVSGSNEEGVFHKATVAVKDEDHDLCLLKISEPALPPMTIGDDSLVREGELVAFTGFPIGLVLGLHPVTHRGIVSAITPIAIPMLSGRQINGEMVERLKKTLSGIPVGRYGLSRQQWESPL